MTTTMTAPPIEQVAPNVVTKVRDGHLTLAQNGAIGAGLVLLGISAAAGMGGDDHGAGFYFAYLVAYMAVLGICLGALFFTMIQHITRAGWSVVVRRVAEHVAGVLPWMLLLFLPIVIGFETLFHWADPDLVTAGNPKFDAVIDGKKSYLNATAFYVRVVAYFGVWIWLAWFFRRGSIQQDQSGDPAQSLRMSRLAAPGLLLFALSLTFAAFDWIMSLDPHWFSTIFGVTYFAGGFMSFLAVLTLLLMWLQKQGYLHHAVTTEHFHDIGKLMFGFMVFWTYVNFSQYMLIWYANLPEETSWYEHRKHGGWDAVGTILIVGHFLVPFAFLMSRHIKRNRLTLAIGAVFLLVMHWVDMQYLILPNMAHGPAPAAAAHEAHSFGHSVGEWLGHLGWLNYTCLIGMGCLLFGLTVFNIRRTNLLPTRDPRLSESLHFVNL